LVHDTLKAAITIFLLFPCFAGSAHAETLVSQVSLGGQGDDGAANFLQVDGGYVIVGNTNSVGAGGQDALIFMANDQGIPLWSTVFGGQLDESAIGVAPLPEGGYAITGRTDSHGAGDTDLFFARVDGQGNLTHLKTFGGADEDRSMGMIPTRDGHFLIFGATRGGTITDYFLQDVMLFKVTAYGDVIWSRAYGGQSSEVSYAARETPEGDYIVFAYGDSWQNQGISTDLYLLKIDKNGDLLWTACYGGPGFEMITASSAGHISPRGEIFIMGTTNSYGAGDFDELLMKFDSQGVLQWTRTIGGAGYDYGRGVIGTSDGHLLAWGLATDPGNGRRNSIVSKFTSDGDELWTRIYGSDQHDDIFRIQEFSADSLVMIGRTASFGQGGYDIWLLRTARDGETACFLTDHQVSVNAPTVPLTPTGAARGGVRLEVSEIDLSSVIVDQSLFFVVDTLCTELGVSTHSEAPRPGVYMLTPNTPNPFNPETAIHFELPGSSQVKLAIYDVNGRLVRDLVSNQSLPAGSYTRHWDGRDQQGREMSAGVYFYRLQAGEITLEQKMLLLK